RALIICNTILIILTGCGDDPAGQAGSPFLPVATGNQWVFEQITKADGLLDGVVTKEVTETEIYQGQNSFVRVTNQTNSPVTKRSNWLIKGEKILRLEQQSLNTSGTLIHARGYDPGFLRFSHALTEAGVTLKEEHVRSEYDATGALESQTGKTYTWTVEAVDEEVTVPAGTFTCVRVTRIDSDVGEKTYWYARNVGKVKESDAEKEELLREYTIQE
ncbi:hypothetical protein ACFL6C_07890, partial [Myxococcota bacterium]